MSKIFLADIGPRGLNFDDDRISDFLKPVNDADELILITDKSWFRFLETVRDIHENSYSVSRIGLKIVMEGISLVLMFPYSEDEEYLEIYNEFLAPYQVAHIRWLRHIRIMYEYFGIALKNRYYLRSVQSFCKIGDEIPESAEIIRYCLQNDDYWGRIATWANDNFSGGVQAKIEELKEAGFTVRDDDFDAWHELAVEKILYQELFAPGRPGFIASKPSVAEILAKKDELGFVPYVFVSSMAQIRDTLSFLLDNNEIAEQIQGILLDPMHNDFSCDANDVLSDLLISCNWIEALNYDQALSPLIKPVWMK